MVGMSWHRSTAMMSAPSSASRTAWLRPWPRAAPVTNATFPCTRPIRRSSFRIDYLCVSAAVDAQDLSGDVAGFLGDQKCARSRDVLGLADAAYGCRLDVLLDEEIAARFRFAQHRGVDEAGRPRIDGDARGPVLQRERLGQAVDRRLGGHVRRHVWLPGVRAGRRDV